MHPIKQILLAVSLFMLIIGAVILAEAFFSPERAAMKVEKCWWCGSQLLLSGQRVYSSWFNDKTFISPCCSMCRDTLLMGPNAKYIVYNDTLFSMFQVDPIPNKHILTDLFERPLFVEVPLHSWNWSDLQKAYYDKIWDFNGKEEKRTQNSCI